MQLQGGMHGTGKWVSLPWGPRLPGALNLQTLQGVRQSPPQVPSSTYPSHLQPQGTRCASQITHTPRHPPGFISSLAFKARESIWLLVVSAFNPARIPEASKPLGPKMQGEQTQILNSISYLAIGISQYPLSNLICIICSTSRLYIRVKCERLQLSRNNNKQLRCFFLLLYFSFFFCRAPGLAESYFPWPVIKPWTAREFLDFCFLKLSKYFGHNDKNLNNFKNTHMTLQWLKKNPPN